MTQGRCETSSGVAQMLALARTKVVQGRQGRSLACVLVCAACIHDARCDLRVCVRPCDGGDMRVSGCVVCQV